MKSVRGYIVVMWMVLAVSPTVVWGSNTWGNYHWARTNNPFTLKLGDNVSSTWDPYLTEASSDWSKSIVLDTTVVAGQTTPQSCKSTNGRVEVCNAKYGYNGWLGIASIWVSGSHITKGVVKLNDTYFATSTYNTPGWRRLVMCQEIGHPLGLDHQDVIFTNPNLGSCMDYTNNPLGPPSNEHPNQHDYDTLETIYSHLDTTTTVGQTTGSTPSAGDRAWQAGQWGRLVRSNPDRRIELYELDLGRGHKVLTHVIWAE